MPEDALLDAAEAAAPEPERVPAAGRGMRGAALLSVGSSLPDGIVSNDEIAVRIGKSDEWIYTRTGIRERRHARPEERVVDHAAAAGRIALERAGLDASALDLVLVGTMTPDEITPNAAPLVAHALGAEQAGAADIGAACTAWLSALALAVAQIECGRVEHALVIGADFISRIVDHDSKATAMLFGDGAGAVVLGPVAAPGRVGPVALRCDGAVAEILWATHERGVLEMDGHETFKHAVNRMVDVTREAVAAAGTTLADVDLFVYHQANGRILSAVAERLALDPAKVVDVIERTGNMSAATVPYALDVALADGRLREGSRVLLAAFGAGLTWGGAVVEWGRGDG